MLLEDTAEYFSYSCKYGDNNHQPQFGGSAQAGGGILLRGGRPSDQRQCRKTARRPGYAATPVQIGWGGIGVAETAECENAHETPTMACRRHALPNLNEQILQNQATSRNITKRASRVAGYALVSSSLI